MKFSDASVARTQGRPCPQYNLKGVEYNPYEVEYKPHGSNTTIMTRGLRPVAKLVTSRGRPLAEYKLNASNTSLNTNSRLEYKNWVVLRWRLEMDGLMVDVEMSLSLEGEVGLNTRIESNRRYKISNASPTRGRGRPWLNTTLRASNTILRTSNTILTRLNTNLLGRIQESGSHDRAARDR